MSVVMLTCDITETQRSCNRCRLYDFVASSCFVVPKVVRCDFLGPKCLCVNCLQLGWWKSEQLWYGPCLPKCIE